MFENREEEYVVRSLRLATVKIDSMPSLRPVPPYGWVYDVLLKRVE